MANKMISTFLSVFTVLAITLQLTAAVNYTVKNKAAATPGGVRFNKEIGVEFTTRTLTSATSFIWSIFQQTSDADRKNVTRVSLFIDDMESIAYTTPSNSKIHVGAKYIQGITRDVKKNITGVLYHEMTHVWQWYGGNSEEAPRGLIEGIADYVRLKAKYIPSHWVRPGGGDRWDDGYAVTARFLDYCNGLRDGFVAELNKKMRDDYNDRFFVELLGKPVDQLWAEYKKHKI